MAVGEIYYTDWIALLLSPQEIVKEIVHKEVNFSVGLLPGQLLDRSDPVTPNASTVNAQVAKNSQHQASCTMWSPPGLHLVAAL